MLKTLICTTLSLITLLGNHFSFHCIAALCSCLLYQEKCYFSADLVTKNKVVCSHHSPPRQYMVCWTQSHHKVLCVSCYLPHYLCLVICLITCVSCYLSHHLYVSCYLSHYLVICLITCVCLVICLITCMSCYLSHYLCVSCYLPRYLCVSCYLPLYLYVSYYLIFSRLSHSSRWCLVFYCRTLVSGSGGHSKGVPALQLWDIDRY